MLDFLLMLQVKLHVVNIIQAQSNKFATGVENQATGDINKPFMKVSQFSV